LQSEGRITRPRFADERWSSNAAAGGETTAHERWVLVLAKQDPHNINKNECMIAICDPSQTVSIVKIDLPTMTVFIKNVRLPRPARQKL